jgi:hypothetical protein
MSNWKRFADEKPPASAAYVAFNEMTGTAMLCMPDMAFCSTTFTHFLVIELPSMADPIEKAWQEAVRSGSMDRASRFQAFEAGMKAGLKKAKEE